MWGFPERDKNSAGIPPITQTVGSGFPQNGKINIGK
jgi:hypothetical protein